MSPEFRIHIGANKTGSSAIQAFLRVNRVALRDMGYLVPDRNLEVSDRVTGEHVFAFQELFNKGDRATIASKIQELGKADAKCVLISAENLSNTGNFQYFPRDLGVFQTKVILYIRRQDELLTSSWQQWYSKRETDLEAWLLLALQNQGQWKRCIDGWEAVVGKGNVIVRVFQKSDLKNGDVVEDYRGLIDLGSEDLQLAMPPAAINPRIRIS